MNKKLFYVYWQTEDNKIDHSTKPLPEEEARNYMHTLENEWNNKNTTKHKIFFWIETVNK
jgi:hypothetical protein